MKQCERDKWPSILLVVAFLVSGCGSLSNPACNSAHELPHMASLMKQSCNGDQNASFQLGDMYERGLILEQNYEAARQYYELAATPTSGTSYIYVPSAGNVAGFTMPVTTGPVRPGHPEAKRRLAQMLLDGRGGKIDVERANRLLEK